MWKMNWFVLGLDVVDCLMDMFLLLYYLKKTIRMDRSIALFAGWNIIWFGLLVMSRYGEWDFLLRVAMICIFVLGNAMVCSGSLIKRFMYGMGYLSANLVTKTIAYGIFVWWISFQKLPYNVSLGMRVLLGKMLLVMYIYAIIIRKEWKMDVLPGNILAGLFLLILSNIVVSIAFAVFFRSSYPMEYANGMELAMVGLLLIAVLTFWLFKALCITYEKLLEGERLKLEYAKKEEKFQEIERQREEIEKIRKDMKKQLLTLKDKIQEKRNVEDNKEILDYIESMKEGLQEKKLQTYTSCFPIDTVLRERFRKAKEVGVKVEHEVRVYDKLKIKRADMGIVLGKLLDHAIEDASYAKKPFVHVGVFQRKDLLMIEIKNSCIVSEMEEMQDRFELKCVEQIVEKYQGRMEANCDDGIYNVRVMLLHAL